MKPALLVAAFVMLAPLVAGLPTNEGGIFEHASDTFVQSRTSPPTGTIFSNTIDNTNQLPWYAINHTHARVAITYTAYMQMTAAGTWTITFSYAGSPITSCAFSFPTINAGVLGGQDLKVIHHAVFCILPIELGVNAAFSASRSTGSGTPSAINQETISYRIATIYHLEPDMTEEITVLNALDFYLPFLFWGGLALFFLTRRAWAPALASTIMTISSLLVTSIWAFPLGVLLILLTVWIHVIAKQGVFEGVRDREPQRK